MNIETRYLLNIGLRFAIGDRRTAGQITPGAVLHELYGVLDQSPVRIIKLTTIEHATEPTVVAELSAPPSRRAVFDLSVKLWQDCIACYDLETLEGELVGPRAEDWGAFDPTAFLLPDGSLLETRRTEPQRSEHSALAADTADFSTYSKCCELSAQGIHFTDATWYKAKRAKEREAKLRLEGAYQWLGINRQALLNQIATDVFQTVPLGGVHVTSSGAFTRRRNATDIEVLARAERQGYCS